MGPNREDRTLAQNALILPSPDKDAAPSIDILNTQALPLEVGAIHLSQDGSITHGDIWSSFEFGFRYREYAFGVTAYRKNDTLCITLSAYLGVIPYSAQCANARDEIFGTIERLPLRTHIHFQITSTQQLFLRAEPVLAPPHTPIRILTAITASLYEAVPHLDHLHAKLYGKVA